MADPRQHGRVGNLIAIQNAGWVGRHRQRRKVKELVERQLAAIGSVSASVTHYNNQIRAMKAALQAWKLHNQFPPFMDGAGRFPGAAWLKFHPGRRTAGTAALLLVS